jgi:hypothetical protein
VSCTIAVSRWSSWGQGAERRPRNGGSGCARAVAQGRRGGSGDRSRSRKGAAAQGLLRSRSRLSLELGAWPPGRLRRRSDGDGTRPHGTGARRLGVLGFLGNRASRQRQDLKLNGNGPRLRPVRPWISALPACRCRGRGGSHFGPFRAC